MRAASHGALSLCALLALQLGSAVAHAQEFEFSMHARSNIYGAGHPVVPNPAGNGGGILPVLVPLPPGTGRKLTFTSVAGSIDYGPCCPTNGPDGIAASGNGAGVDWDGIGGMTLARGRFLSAVLLDDSEPSDPPPDPLVFDDIDFASVSPGLRQTFFVGDGLTGTGVGNVQVFDVPDAATRLFLGVHDTGPPDTSVPGFYDDNFGTTTGAVTVTRAARAPALAPWALGLLVALLALLSAKAVKRFV